MDFALSNGMDGLALTDHGNMNGFAHQMNHADKLKKGGVKFKAIPGVEAYFHPSLTQWRRLKDETKAALDAAKFEKDHPSKVGNEMAEAEAELQEISDGKTPSEGSAGDGEADSDEDGGTIVENEEESKGGNAKSNKARDPLKQRSHLVLLPKNSAGLNAIFNLVSDSAADGFYMYPRVDFDMINKHAKGNVIALTACIAGYPAKIVFDHQTEPDWKLWVPNRDNFEKIQDELCKSIEEFQHALGGKENYFLEMQFNKLGAQHLVNMHLIEAAKRTGAQLVVTCDAHYSHPDHWREREIYKAIGWQMKGGASNDLPQSVAELKCELYPKNAKQVWDSYKFYCEGHGFYDDTIVKDAIERTHDIAHQLLGDVQPKGGLQTPWAEGLNGRYLEDLGFLKFDILGLGTLRMFEDCIRKILIRHHGIKHPTFAQVREYFDNKLHPDVNPMDDMKVFKNVFWDNRYAGVFQFVQKNTQSFMAQMKPTSVLDIAIATSIFRPGPLGLKADKLYLNNRLNPTSIEYEEQTMEQVLGPTAGLLIFQEQLQLLVHKLAGWHLDDTDAVRKAFTKKDKAGQAKIEKEREDLRVQFVSGAKTHLGMDEQSANNVWADFSKWTAYGFNKSHAMAYAITTYQCAWFLTYYPDEWITTYIDYCTTEKGKVNGKEDPKVVAMSEARRLGYSIVSPDLNNSEFEFTIDANNPKVLIPGFASLKNVGKSALYEIKRFRPYTQVQDLLIDTNGSWRHSKFNKRALGNLIKLEALESMKLVGNGSEPTHMFRTYREAHDILVDGYDTLKRISARKKNNDVTAAIKKMVEDYRAKFKEPQDWTNVEKIKFNAEIAGYVDMDLLVKPAIKQRLEELNLDSIDAFPLPDPEDTEKVSSAHWAIIRSATIATAKNGPYLLLKLFAETGQEYRVNSWGWKGPIDKFVPNAVIAGVFDFNPKFGGFTVWKNKLFIVDDKA